MNILPPSPVAVRSSHPGSLAPPTLGHLPQKECPTEAFEREVLSGAWDRREVSADTAKASYANWRSSLISTATTEDVKSLVKSCKETLTASVNALLMLERQEAPPDLASLEEMSLTDRLGLLSAVRSLETMFEVMVYADKSGGHEVTMEDVTEDLQEISLNPNPTA